MSETANGSAPVAKCQLDRLATCRLPTRWGVFDLYAFGDKISQHREHLVLAMGDLKRNPAPLVRLHSECLTGDALFSTRCDCGAQLETAMAMIAAERCGMILYLRQEGRGIGLGKKLAAYALQDEGLDTVDANHRLGFAADLRDYSVAVALLRAFQVSAVRLLTNNPEKVRSLERGGVKIVSRIPLLSGINPYNVSYLRTKSRRLGHWIDPYAMEPPGAAAF